MIETSLLPSVIALNRFFSDHFPHISWYPYWYLGNPYFYMTGPVIPLVLSIFTIFSIQLLTGYITFIIASIFLGGFGVFLFLRDFNIKNKSALIAGIFYVFFPAIYWTLSYQNGVKHIALVFIPFLLLIYKKYLRYHSLKTAFLLSVIIALTLLTNAASLLTIIIGCLTMLLSFDYKRKEELFLKTCVIIFLGLFISTFWYTPSFWWVSLVNPSVGGIPLIRLLWKIFQILLQLSPIVLAILVVKWRGSKISEYRMFSLLFFISFVLLTVLRFVFDPDFIMDWTGYVPELQMGGAFMVASFSGRLMRRKGILIFVAIMVTLLDGYIVKNYFPLLLGEGQPRLNRGQGEVNKVAIQQYNNSETSYKKRITNLIIKNVPKSERVFLSGSPVFWINTSTDIMQVRGGNDATSIHQWWAHGAYQIREGKEANLTAAWLRILGASYILVHSASSIEPFHDFKNVRKYEDQEYFTLVDSGKGDYLYKVNNASIGRIAENSILTVPTPKNGADSNVLFQYTNHLKRAVNSFLYTTQDIRFTANLGKKEVISLAISYDSRWIIIKGNGAIVKDALSNIVILPERPGKQEFVLQYRRNTIDWLVPLFSSTVLILLLIKFFSVFPYLQRFISKLSIGLHADEKDY